jgi:4-hydroxythreonine-4-phosphate dehydrogenase
MNSVAIALGGALIYWSALIVCLGVAAWFFLSLSLNRSDGGQDGALWLLFPLAMLFSVLLSRLLHWYCHSEQYASLFAAMTDYRSGLFDVLVTAPINKATIQSPSFHFPGHTEYIETSVGEGKKALMILMNDVLRVALVTTHLPIKDIAKAISKEAIIEKATIFHQSLRRDFRISCPRIAVLSLNPHAGDNGLLGAEEKDIIQPAIEQLVENGIQAFGPYAADGFFGSGSFNYFDGVLAMYHDQGLAPFKTIALDNGVNYTAGLPIVRTSPDHGTAYDIAGQGKADENSFRQAIYTAIDIWRNRQNYDEPLKNPLPKLFHEKREDGNKARFAQPRPKDMFKKEKPGKPETEAES